MHWAWLGSVVAGLGLAGSLCAGEPLVYERFEKAAGGKIEGGVRFAEDVVGWGGLEMPNQ